ncbi:transcriptional regulator KorA [Acidovorax sp. CCYZU-2555]|uniref:transcriptional regulator KorA n=1 Tax=Acidovorax sp. CCYZU-2555 TaxID=2835042 RepID=UPI001BCD57B5|nr:transcriptional regulator KorA [Acidovorax sp. CCYZU-2555]MBS7780628.1 transcriptional regulator KorA [Acidovorax sp. CCYZU-2555]
MRKRLSEAQFQACIRGLDVGAQTLQIAHGVLVCGQTQASFVQALGLSKGAVSQAVHRVWRVFARSNIPPGYERVSAVLPQHQAFIVKKWAEDAQARNNGSKI